MTQVTVFTIGARLFEIEGLAAAEGVEPSSSSSKPDVLPVTPSRSDIVDCRLLITD
jgi:hypothetical protein